MAIISLVILALLTLISNDYWVKIFGGKTWRRLLRLAYIAFIAATFHYVLKTYEDIFIWINGHGYIPPIAATFLILTLVILVARIFVEIFRRFVKKPPLSKV